MSVDYSLLSQGGPFQAVEGYKVNWNYTNLADSISTITASGYFNVPASQAGNYRPVSQYDSILATGSDSSTLLIVTSATGATPVTTVSITGAGALALDYNYIFQGNGDNVAIGFPVTGNVTATGGNFTINPNVIASSNVFPNLIQYQNVNVTSANILAMYATPVQVLAAPGAGLGIVIDKVITNYQYATDYSGGDNIVLQYGNTVHAGGVEASTVMLPSLSPGANVVSSAQGIIYTGGSGVSSTGVINTAIYISNATAPYTGGTSTMVLNIWYKIITMY